VLVGVRLGDEQDGDRPAAAPGGGRGEPSASSGTAPGGSNRADPSADPSAAPTADPTGEPTGDPTGGATNEPPADPMADPTVDIAQLLASRARAVLRRDRAAFLATVDRRSATFRRRQAALFDNLADVPLAQWRYHVDAEGGALGERRAARLGGDTVTAHVSLRHRLRGFPDSVSTRRQYLTFVRRPAGWRVAADTDGKTAERRTAREVWDYGPVNVARGRRSIVLGLAPREELARLAATADRAVTDVAEVWGKDWPRRVVVVAPDTVRQLASIVDSPRRQLSRIAAVTTGQYLVAGEQRSTDRVVLNPAAFAKLAPLGNDVVLTHEVTHVATRSGPARDAPIWLSEGFADYVAYLDTGLPVELVAGELLEDVRRGRVPRRLPDHMDFRATSKELAQAYQMSWLACLRVAELRGQHDLVRLYRAVGRAGADEERTERVFRRVLGQSQREFVRAWRGYLRTLE